MTYTNHASTDKTILRKSKLNNFTVINNDILRNKKLSWKAKGLLCYLLSLPDNWHFNYSHLEQQATDGRDSLASGMKELREAGHLELKVLKDRGRIIRNEWIVHEEPTLPSDAEKPCTEKPFPENPNSGNPSLLNTNPNQVPIEPKTKENNLYVPTQESLELATLLLDSIKKFKPDYRSPSDLNKWAKDIELMIRKDERTPDAILRVIKWLPNDSFWRKVILSAGKLREKFDALELQIGSTITDEWIRVNRNFVAFCKKDNYDLFKHVMIKGKFALGDQNREVSLEMKPEAFERAFLGMCRVKYEK